MNLHSIMVRLKGSFPNFSSKDLIYLHSIMVRLKGRLGLVNIERFFYLHSIMVRLKVRSIDDFRFVV